MKGHVIKGEGEEGKKLEEGCNFKTSEKPSLLSVGKVYFL